VAVFAAASEVFSQRNTNCSIAESLTRFEPVMAAARERGVAVRGYISCVLGCPYEGEIAPDAVARVAKALFDMGCHEISVGDTIGVGTPGRTKAMIEACAAHVPMGKLAGHYHDTYGQALANIYASLEMGVAVFDSSVAGLGRVSVCEGRDGQRRVRGRRVHAPRSRHRHRHRPRPPDRCGRVHLRGARPADQLARRPRAAGQALTFVP
jgi:hydroxymethylglutaryl-CoA lyase